MSKRRKAKRSGNARSPQSASAMGPARAGQDRPEHLAAMDIETLVERLKQAGQHPPGALLEAITRRGEQAVAPLIQLATDEELNQASSDSAEVWAPLHAVRLLGELRAPEAVEPLLPLFALDDDWFDEALPEAFGRIGRPALEPLRALLFDQETDVYAAGGAAEGLKQIAEQHPELRAAVVEALIARLDPAESRSANDEEVNGYVVSRLLDLGAKEALPAIRRAFEADRIDRWIVDYQSVEEALGAPAEPHLYRGGRPPTEGKRELLLSVRCKKCGAQSDHWVDKLYLDLGTVERKDRGEAVPYSEYIIPQEIVCAKCGAVDEYELSGMSYVQLTAEVLRTRAGEADSPLVVAHLGLGDGRQMHPFEALEMYRERVEIEPRDAQLRVRYGNVLRSLGKKDQAMAQYRQAVRLDPTNVEALANVANLLLQADDVDRGAVRRVLDQVMELAPAADLQPAQADELANFAIRTRAALDRAERGEALPERYPQLESPMQPPQLAVQQPRRTAARPAPGARLGSTSAEDGTTPPLVRRTEPKVGRNDPCPCGSGKKYKRCHGR